MNPEGPTRRATLLVNPAARRVARAAFDPRRVARYLERHGVEITVAIPDSPASATREAAASAARGDHLLFAVGGDGTLRDVAQGLAGSSTALAAIPGGTVNIFCVETRIPRSFRAAFDAHLGGHVTPMDLGRANGSPFLLMASLGWDAAIARDVPAGLKRRLGDNAYIVQGLRRLPGLRTVRTRWRTGIVVHDRPLALMVVSNTRLYGGRVRFSPGATADDGLLDVVALCPTGPVSALRLAARVPLAAVEADALAVTDRVTELDVETPGLAVQLDGDYVFDSPVSFSVEAAALAVSLPAGSLPPIFTNGR